MSEDFEMELTFPAHVKIVGRDGKYNALVSRHEGDRKFPVAALKDLTSSECYTRLGAKIPAEKVEEKEGIEKAKGVLSAALTKAGGRTMISRSEFDDILLDAMNELGWHEPENEEAL